VARQVVKSQQPLLETLLTKAVALAEAQVPAVQTAALQHWQQQNHAEIARLKALAAVNPAVRPAEIQAH
jgi:ATP-dependent helicase HepA